MMTAIKAFQIKIDKGVPMPMPANAKKYPFPLMEIGDSFFSTSTRGSIYAAAKRDGVIVTVREVKGGRRCWRIE